MPSGPGSRSTRRGDGLVGGRRLVAGQGLVEYGIILGLSVLLMAILLVFFDDQVAAVLDWLTNQLP